MCRKVSKLSSKLCQLLDEFVITTFYHLLQNVIHCLDYDEVIPEACDGIQNYIWVHMAILTG